MMTKSSVSKNDVKKYTEEEKEDEYESDEAKSFITENRDEI